MRCTALATDTVRRPTLPPPNLAALDLDQAAALEQISTEALIGFGRRSAELGGRVHQAAPRGRYEAEMRGQIDSVGRLEAMARLFRAAANARSRAADRERCRAIRAVESLAAAALAGGGIERRAAAR